MPAQRASSSTEPQTAEPSNRAARRARGKGTPTTGTGKVQQPGRRNPVVTPRLWAVRRSG